MTSLLDHHAFTLTRIHELFILHLTVDSSIECTEFYPQLSNFQTRPRTRSIPLLSSKVCKQSATAAVGVACCDGSCLDGNHLQKQIEEVVQTQT